jgi:AraC-like DNA-binding protein
MGMSRPQLYRKTTSLTGKSPNDFIKEIRMRKAWHLLKLKKGNISEVALEVGYSNPSYFSKIFHESFGCTPSELYATIR